MRDPEVRRRILAEAAVPPGNRRLDAITQHFHKLFPMGEQPDYEPRPEESVAGLAARQGRPAAEVAYDLLLEDEGRRKFYFPIYNYTASNLDVVREMMSHPATLLGLGDAGAHCGYICDASMPTFMLTHWVRGRTRGPTIPLEMAVRRQTSDTAGVYGLNDRGRIAPGLKADLNLIDLDRLRLMPPTVAFDLPAGGRRLTQASVGYLATFVNGEAIMENGEPTGALPGRLLRGPQRG
jgi:N-acyl-D-amino-acid deacylase